MRLLLVLALCVSGGPLHTRAFAVPQEAAERSSAPQPEALRLRGFLGSYRTARADQAFFSRDGLSGRVAATVTIEGDRYTAEDGREPFQLDLVIDGTITPRQRPDQPLRFGGRYILRPFERIEGSRKPARLATVVDPELDFARSVERSLARGFFEFSKGTIRIPDAIFRQRVGAGRVEVTIRPRLVVRGRVQALRIEHRSYKNQTTRNPATRATLDLVRVDS